MLFFNYPLCLSVDTHSINLLSWGACRVQLIKWLLGLAVPFPPRVWGLHRTSRVLVLTQTFLRESRERLLFWKFSHQTKRDVEALPLHLPSCFKLLPKQRITVGWDAQDFLQKEWAPVSRQDVTVVCFCNRRSLSWSTSSYAMCLICSVFCRPSERTKVCSDMLNIAYRGGLSRRLSRTHICVCGWQWLSCHRTTHKSYICVCCSLVTLLQHIPLPRLAATHGV